MSNPCDIKADWGTRYLYPQPPSVGFCRVLRPRGCVIKTVSRLFHIAPLFVLRGAHYLSVFSADQLQALALLFLKVNDHGAAIALVFFGGLPHFQVHPPASNPGRVGMFGGLGWLTFLYPPLGYRLFLYLAALGLLGAAALILWLWRSA